MSPGDSLPTDPDALRTLLLAERERHAEELERLAAIIKELQRTVSAVAPSGSIPSSWRWRWKM